MALETPKTKALEVNLLSTSVGEKGIQAPHNLLWAD